MATARPNVLGEADSSLYCLICHQLTFKPVSCLDCMNSIYCQECITDWLKTNPTCPMCRNDWKKTTINYLAQNFIDKVAAACPFCNKQDLFGNICSHLQICELRPVKCSYDGCDAQMLLNERAAHELNCQYAMVVCACQAQLKRKDYNNHLQTCPVVLIGCNLCGAQYQRQDTQYHVSVACTQRHVTCELKDIGCNWSGPVAMLQAHVNMCAFAPAKKMMETMTKKMQEQDAKISTLTSTVNELSMKNGSLTAQVENLEVQVAGLKQQVNQLKLQQTSWPIEPTPVVPHVHQLVHFTRPTFYQGLSFNCDKCGIRQNGAGYHCYDCGNYDICMKCQHYNHTHVYKKRHNATFTCSTCNKSVVGQGYKCSQCNTHQCCSCHGEFVFGHNHQLKHVQKSVYASGTARCDLCKTTVPAYTGMYHCFECGIYDSCASCQNSTFAWPKK